jgi:hypothetical protein
MNQLFYNVLMHSLPCYKYPLESRNTTMIPATATFKTFSAHIMQCSRYCNRLQCLVKVLFKKDFVIHTLINKAVPLHHSGSKGRGNISPAHLDHGTRWGWVVSVTPRPRFNPSTHCTRGWVGFRFGLDTEARGKILCLCRRSIPGRPVCSQQCLL